MSEGEATTDSNKRSREDEDETPTTTDSSEPPAKASKPSDGPNDEDTPEDTNATSGDKTAAQAPAPAPNPAAQADTPATNTQEETKTGTNGSGAATEAPAPSPAPVPAVAPGPAPGGVPSGVPTAFPPQQQQAVNPSAPATVTNAAQLVEETGEVSALYVGRVIGKGGEMIRDLQARSSCRIDVDQSVPPGQPRIITYRGTRKTVDFAKKLVTMLTQENVNEADLPLGDAKRDVMSVPATSVGKIIGRGGEMIRELQSRSHAKIQVDHNTTGSGPTAGQHKRLTITGTDQSVVKAREMVLFLVANPHMDAMQALTMLMDEKSHRGGVWGSGPPYHNMPNMGQNMMPHMVPGGGGTPGGYPGGSPGAGGYGDPNAYGGAAAGGYPPAAGYGAPPVAAAQPPAAGYGGSEVEIFYAAKTFMGRIIGQKGVTINDLQRRSGCDIQINQEVPHGSDCEISLRGPRQGIESAKQMLREIIEVGPNHPYAGGAPQPSAGYGGYGQDPYQQAPYGYGQPYYPPHPGYGQPYDQGYGYQPAYGYQQPYYGYAAPPPPGGAGPWKSATAGDGQIYYYNEKTGETQWDKPPGFP